MVAFGLLLSKFSKSIKLYFGAPVHEHFQYLLNICRYNLIEVLFTDNGLVESTDTLVVCDTPKPDMIDASPSIRSLISNGIIPVIEIDHHIGADSEYIGGNNYSLVSEASSACELIGLMGLKLCNRRDLLKTYNISDPFPRNFVLAILSGIIGDTKMGRYIKSKRERKFYQIFSTKYNKILLKETTKDSNFSDQDQVFRELERLSLKEELCFNFIFGRKKSSQSIGFVVLEKSDMDYLFTECGNDTVVSVTRTIADILAEDSGKLSLIAYYDNPELSDLIQFRLRRSKKFKNYDVRDVLKVFGIETGGGHEGAIGFRIPKGSVDDLNPYVERLVNGIEQEIAGIEFSE